MRMLEFHSDLLEKTDRYSKGFSLPDYPYTKDGEFDRKRAIETVLYEEYGIVNAKGVTCMVSAEKVLEKQVAGKCRETLLQFTFSKGEDTHTVPVHLFEPYRAHKTVIHISFNAEIPNKYCPIEELLDRGVGVAYVYYNDITSDNDDFSNGLARFLCDRSDPHSAGKISVWSYMLSRIADHLLEQSYTTPSDLYVAGHSRLGKTVLLTAAKDKRFAGVCVNDSGCCGAAISREKTGETLEKICVVFPYWFCTSFYQYINNEEKLPFDQHWLGACVAPRKLCVNTAIEDTWADTDAQYLMVEAADVIYCKMGVVGLEPIEVPLADACSTKHGNIAFSKRLGTHFFSREDWNFFLDFIKA